MVSRRSLVGAKEVYLVRHDTQIDVEDLETYRFELSLLVYPKIADRHHLVTHLLMSWFRGLLIRRTEPKWI